MSQVESPFTSVLSCPKRQTETSPHSLAAKGKSAATGRFETKQARKGRALQLDMPRPVGLDLGLVTAALNDAHLASPAADGPFVGQIKQAVVGEADDGNRLARLQVARQPRKLECGERIRRLEHEVVVGRLPGLVTLNNERALHTQTW